MAPSSGSLQFAIYLELQIHSEPSRKTQPEWSRSCIVFYKVRWGQNDYRSLGGGQDASAKGRIWSGPWQRTTTGAIVWEAEEHDSDMGLERFGEGSSWA